MRVDGCGRTWHVEDAKDLDEAIACRDSRGGGLFWLTHENEFPALCIRVSGRVADVHFFPSERHPSFRCLGGEGLPEGGSTTLVFDGCDRGYGEEEPNEFIVSFETASLIAKDFLASSQMSTKVKWLEL